MGIDASWKNTILPNNFSAAFSEDNPEVDYIIDDFSLVLRKFFYGINNWRDVRTRIYNRLTGINRPDLLKKYVILFDESEFVPSAKRPTQRERREDPRYKSKPISPFSQIEKAEFKIGIDYTPKLTSPFGEHVEKMWISGKEIMNQIITFVQNEVIYHYLTHKPPFEILIDGCRIDQNDNSTDSALSGIKISDIRLDYNHAQVLHLSRTQGVVRGTITDSFGIGESDMKIPRHISLLPKGKILVFGDSDTIPIVLLNLRRWICEDTGMFKHRIYLGKEVTKKPSKSVIDLTDLWRLIQIHMEHKCPDIIYPIEAVVVLMLLTGSDYSQKLLNKFGPTGVWNAFRDGGYKFFLKDGAVQSNLEYGMDKIENRFPVIFLNHKVYDFIYYIYKTKFPAAGGMTMVRKMAAEADRKTVAEAERKRKIVEEAERKKKIAVGTNRQRKPSTYNVAGDDELYANIRRMWWNVEYLANGITDVPFPDATEVHKESGLSTHGWITKMVDGKSDVFRAPKVHTFSNPQE